MFLGLLRRVSEDRGEVKQDNRQRQQLTLSLSPSCHAHSRGKTPRAFTDKGASLSSWAPLANGFCWVFLNILRRVSENRGEEKQASRPRPILHIEFYTYFYMKWDISKMYFLANHILHIFCLLRNLEFFIHWLEQIKLLNIIYFIF